MLERNSAQLIDYGRQRDARRILLSAEQGQVFSTRPVIPEGFLRNSWMRSTCNGIADDRLAEGEAPGTI